ncbi:HEAT repeat domain-containing protein [Flagellimonas meishanensis]|uniref:HEAT repeat domain-containing protein n=1 Tax=Flagellimonas meishanensis TaxID=2873264 RepID=UPI001CA6925C|nr:HEAT repeat domain-containing protein [[Muricauda] meishanensis]
MGFYDLSKEERARLVSRIESEIVKDLKEGSSDAIQTLFSDEDTYVRKAAYQAIGKIEKDEHLDKSEIVSLLNTLMKSDSEKIRQTTVNAAGELGKTDFKVVEHLFDLGLFDEHHSVRNAVIGSIKKMGQKNHEPVLEWAKKYLDHPDKEVRREICHGIELRGRTHPEDILPLLRQLQHDPTARVRNTLIHVLGQISYKKGCLRKVVGALLTWENEELVKKALDEIVDVHRRYKNFAVLTQDQAIELIDEIFLHKKTSQ